MARSRVSLEWFGTTTFRLRANGLTIFLDSYLERPGVLPRYLSIDDVNECDYIFISHAHFDHLPGADRLALRTGAIVVANGEAINCLRQAGVPDSQLYPVQGGERIPLFPREVHNKAAKGEVPVMDHPGAPPLPHHSLAAMAAHIWPGLHCLMPMEHSDIPETLDTGTAYTGEAHPYVCTLEQTRGMKDGLLRIGSRIPRENQDQGMRSFVDFVEDRTQNVFSHFDCGQLMVNFVLDEHRAILYSSHLGGYEGVMQAIHPKPQVAILGIAGRANLNGRPFDGSAAEFALRQVNWLGMPKEVIWCLHDECPIRPYRIDTRAATEMVEKNTDSRVLELKPAEAKQLDLTPMASSHCTRDYSDISGSQRCG